MHKLMTVGLAFVGPNDVAESMSLEEVVGHIRTKPNTSSS